jgi:uncharacterized DUF497 family protein
MERGPGFEWDFAKAEQNILKHEVSFDEAATVFLDPFSITLDDEGHSLDEPRSVTVGFSILGRLLVVSSTERRENIRIISARTANAAERKRHEER